MRTIEALIELCSELGYCVVNGIQNTLETIVKKLPQILDILTPFVCMGLVVAMYYERGSLQFGGEWCVPIVMVILKWFAQVVNDMHFREVYGFPVARKRFTKKREDGTIEFKTSEIVEIVEYLAEVEDYCSKRGLYDKK